MARINAYAVVRARDDSYRIDHVEALLPGAVGRSQGRIPVAPSERCAMAVQHAGRVFPLPCKRPRLYAAARTAG